MAAVVVVTAVLLLLVIAVGAGIAVFDRRDRRDEEAVWLQTRVARRLQRDAHLSVLSIRPVVRFSDSRQAPVVVTLQGQVPNDAVRRTVLDAAAEEIARSRPGLHFELQDELQKAA
jgi:hypothetical protein